MARAKKENMAERKEKVNTILQRIWWICGIFTGLLTIIFTIYQLKINDRLVKESRLSEQPVFQVTYDYWQSDSSYIKDHVDFRLDNKGEEPRHIETPRLYTYIKLDYSGSYKETSQVFYIPIEYYFGWVLPTHNLTGKVAFTYTYTPNNAYFGNLVNESIAYSQKEHVSVFVSMVYIAEIHYLDKYNEAKGVYFINEEEVEETAAKEIMQKAEEYFGFNMYRMENLDIENLLEICGIREYK